MRNLWIILWCLFAVQAAQAEEIKPARIHGQIKDFAGGNVLMYYSKKVDTLQVDKNGVFDYSVAVENPEAVRLIFEEYKCSINLFVENGMDARLVISFAQESEGDKNGYQLQFV